MSFPGAGSKHGTSIAATLLVFDPVGLPASEMAHFKRAGVLLWEANGIMLFPIVSVALSGEYA